VRVARVAFAVLAISWVVLLVAAPVAALGAPLSAAAYALGALLCHQRAERSFHIDSAQLPVCARCFGIYAGAVLGLLLRGVHPSAADLRAVLVAAAIPTLVTWGSEVAGLWSASNLARFLSALPLGAAVAVTVNYVECAPLRPTALRPPRMPI
jgi:uncharacterized membrane protein